MKFDVVVGNPPYQGEQIGTNTQAPSVYNLFYDLSEKISKEYCLISPARFLANQGVTPRAWNQKMLNDEHLNIVYFNPKSDEIFPNTDIKGGIVVLFRHRDKIFGAIETFIPFEELRSIYQKVKAHKVGNISELVSGADSYRFTDELFDENPVLIGRTDKQHARAVATVVFDRYPEVFHDAMPEGEQYVQIYGRLNGERVFKYVKRKYLTPHTNLDKWKIFVAKANGTGGLGETLSEPVIAQPGTGHSQTFVSMGRFDTGFEAEALLKYVKSKFARSLFSILKVTQDINPATWAKVPLQDFTSKSDIDWTKSIPAIDRQLYAKYGLDEQEIAFIEEKVTAME
jgi:hypothetical protein